MLLLKQGAEAWSLTHSTPTLSPSTALRRALGNPWGFLGAQFENHSSNPTSSFSRLGKRSPEKLLDLPEVPQQVSRLGSQSSYLSSIIFP